MDARPPPQEAPPGARRPSLLRVAPLFYGLLLALAVLWNWWAGIPLFYASPADAVRGVAPLRDAGSGVLAAAIVILVSSEVARRTAWGAALARELAQLLGPLSLGACVWIGIVSAIGEECFFRGALQPRLGLLATSVLFGLAHFAPRRELLPWTLFSLVAGLLLGWLYEATGNLLAPIVTHALVNAINLRLLVRPDTQWRRSR